MARPQNQLFERRPHAIRSAGFMMRRGDMHSLQMVLCIEAVETTVARLRGAPMTPPTQEHVMSPVQFDLVTHWRIPAPVDAVWAALTHPQAWPDWWPYVRSVVTLRTGDADGLGSVRRIDWATRLPYDIVIEVEVVEVRRPELLRALSRGQLSGEGLWSLRADGPCTDVTYVWRVALTKHWMRLLAPVLAPVFRWNHAGVMRAGEAGLTRHLGHRAGTP